MLGNTIINKRKKIMNKDKLSELLNFLLETTEQGVNFTKKQLPLLANELIKLELIKSTFILIFGAIYTILLSSIVYFNIHKIINSIFLFGNLRNDEGWFYIFCFGWIIPTVFLIPYKYAYIACKKIILINFAPRLFLIKRTKELINEIKE